MVSVGGNAITVNAAGANVKLRNLVIRPLGVGGNGVGVLAAASVLLDGVTLENLSIALQVTGSGTVKVKDSLLRTNNYGIEVTQANGANIVLSVDGTTFVENLVALAAGTASTTGIVRVTVDNCVVNGVGTYANGAMSFGGYVDDAAPVRASVVRTKFAGHGAPNGHALVAFGSATMLTVGDSHFSGFGTGVSAANGVTGLPVLRTFGNNMFDDVGSNSSMAPVPLQ